MACRLLPGLTVTRLRVVIVASLSVLVAGAARAQSAPSTCPPGQVANAVFDLFRPNDPARRASAAWWLGLCGEQRAVGALQMALAHDPEPNVRAHAAGALAVVGGASARPALELALGDAAPQVRAEVVTGLARLQADELVLQRLEDPAEADEVRAAALAALQLFGRTPDEARLAALAASIEVPRGASPTPNLQAQLERIRAARAVPAPPASAPSEIAAAVPPRLQLAPAAVTPPTTPPSGLALAVTTSVVAGGVWGAGLGLLSQQDGVGVLTLLGTAGAIIGGGTAWGLARLGVRPSPEQSIWFANTTAWGAFAGWMAYAGSGSDSAKLRWGLIVGGESLGVAVGAWSAHRFGWTAGQTAMADGLLLGSLAGVVGLGRIASDTDRVSPVLGYGTAPLMVASAVAARRLRLTSPDAAFVASAPTALAWNGWLLATGVANSSDRDRVGQGALLAGAGLGFVGAASIATAAHPAPVRSLYMGAGVLTGNVLGLGVHMLADPNAPVRWRSGAAIGGLTLGAVGWAAGEHLRGGPLAWPLTIEGALATAGVWRLAVAAGEPSFAAGRRTEGGLLVSGVVGGAVGLAVSRRWSPSADAQLATAAATGAGILAGLGTARLAFAERGAADFTGVAGGAAVGFAGGLLAARLRLDGMAVAPAGIVGGAWGALIGYELPSLEDRQFEPGRRNQGGASLGLSLGGVGAVALASATGARPADAFVAATGGVFGAGMGVGAGLMTHDQGTRAERVGLVVGSTAGGAAALLLNRPLGLSAGPGPAGVRLFFVGGALGAFEGLLLAGAIDREGKVATAPGERLQGGLLFGASLGSATGLLVSTQASPTGAQLFGDVAVSGLGALAGVGTAQVLSATPGRADTLLTMGGSLAGLGAAVFAQHASPWTGPDVGAAAVAGTVGGIVGSLAPTWGDAQWPGWERQGADAGRNLGLSLGAIGGLTLAHATGADERQVRLAGLGAGDGLLTGLGFGLLLDRDSQGARIGTSVGVLAGAGLGAAVWPRLLALEGERAVDPLFVVTTTGLAGWYAYWTPKLGHAQASDVSARTTTGAVMASTGAASFLALGVSPWLRVDQDLIGDALVLDALMGASAAAAAHVASARDDAPVWGLLGGGTAGLVLGAALHERIAFAPDRIPVFMLGGAEGAFIGALAPGVLGSTGDRGTAAASGALGGVALATIASTVHVPSAHTTALAGTGAILGGGIAGGVALVSTALDPRVGQGLAMGGSVLGLGVGALAAPLVSADVRTPVMAVAGAALGTAEALAFAWAGRANDRKEYVGAGLIGAGVGATLGLAAATSPLEAKGNGLASAGFAAWGAWVGSFSGGLVDRNAHEVTLGGLIGANAGYALGWGVLQAEWVQPQDFGWLSLFGAAGTLAAGGVGAVLSSKDKPEPAFAGLAAGPVVGMSVGALALPWLRSLRRIHAQSSTSGPPARSGEVVDSTEVLRRRENSSLLARGMAQIIDVASWMPMVTAAPTTPNSPGPPPVVVGVTGTLR